MNAPRTCAELGVCQGRADCAACSYDAPARPARLSGVDYPFAPGVLQRGPGRARPAWRKWLGALLAGVALAAAVLVLGKGGVL